MQHAGRALNWAYQSAVYAAQDEESKDSLMQEMWRRKENVSTYSVLVSGVGKVKDIDLGLCQNGSERIKEARLSGIMALGKEATPKWSPMNLNENNRAMG